MLTAKAAVKQTEAANIGQMAAPAAKIVRLPNRQVKRVADRQQRQRSPTRIHFTWLCSMASVTVRKLWIGQRSTAIPAKRRRPGRRKRHSAELQRGNRPIIGKIAAQAQQSCLPIEGKNCDTKMRPAAHKPPPASSLDARQELLGAWEDHVEVQHDHRQKHAAHHETDNQERLRGNMRPVIAAHVSAEGDDAQQEKLGCRGFRWPLPENQGPMANNASFTKNQSNVGKISSTASVPTMHQPSMI